jgi:hypothetical protein
MQTILFSFLTPPNEWNHNLTEKNEKVKHAYRAMKIITLQEAPKSKQYEDIKAKIINSAMGRYNYTGKTGEKYEVFSIKINYQK